MEKRVHILSALIAVCLIGLLTSTGVSRAADDDIPFFAGATGLPNVFFIFDNSDSMQDLSYPRKDGSTVRPNGWQWRRGVVVDDDGTIAEDANGNILYDNSKFVSEEELILPGQNPPYLPGLGSTGSTVTSIAGESSNRIYDTNVDWNDASVLEWTPFTNNYRYWKVKIMDSNNVEQVRTIYSRSTSGNYWQVDVDIDYSGVEPYTYEIMAGFPGEVTYKYISDSRYVFDRNFDWSTIPDWTTFSNNYRYKKLEITAGTNVGEIREIYSYSSSSGYWQLSTALPLPCDYTTRYRILGSPDDNRKASGGNHPASKLYQAKKALKTFLESDAIKVCKTTDPEGNCIEEQYRLNMGFSTYMTARIPRGYSKYYRKVAGATTTVPDRWYGYYKQSDNASDRTYYNPVGDNSFTITNLGDTCPHGQGDWDGSYTYTNVAVGDVIDRLFHPGQCDEQIIEYRVMNIYDAPSDSLPDRKAFLLQSKLDTPDIDGGYLQYGWRNFDDPGEATSCDTLPATDGSWTLVPVGDPCYQECYFQEGHETTTGDYYETKYVSYYGNYTYDDPNKPGYIDPDTLDITPYRGYCNGSWWCNGCDPDPEDTSGDGYGDYTLVTEENAASLIGVPINADGDLGDITPNTFDWSWFRYPGGECGDTDGRPHGWSYKKTADDYVYYYYKYCDYCSTWNDADQPEPFFPAEVFDEQANHKGDDQIIFVNLPVYDDLDPNMGDDTTGQSVARILNYVDLARVPHPYQPYSNYDMTMMPFSGSLPSNSGSDLWGNNSSAVTGQGTPLEATLKDAKKYFESYFAQDQFTQGGCRNNYIILLTDGLETCAEGETQEERNAKVVAAADSLFNLTVGTRAAPVKVYVVGFGLDEDSKATLNAIAEAGGTDQAYFATNVEELVDVLTEDIMSEIVGDSFTRSAAVVSRILEESDQLKIYYSYFDYPVWRGHMMAYNLNEDGTIGSMLEGWNSDCTGDGERDGDAGCEMASNGRGTVYTVVGGSRIEFSTDNLADLKSLVNPDGEDIDGNSSPDENADAEAVIGYTLDPGYDNGKYVGTRDSEWPLGDIYNSVPVAVTRPKFRLEYKPGYDSFKAGEPQHSRQTMIYVGANDGMLHAIKESDGNELWAWIPNCLLGTLHEFKDGHRFTVDLKVKAADVDLSPGCTGADWKTMAVCGLRKGGNSYFAVDVTDPTNPQAMWEMTDGNMGRTWSVPAFGRININGDPTSVIFVGGGYSPDADKGNRLYILEAATGNILAEITVGTSALNNVPSEVLAVRYQMDQQGNVIEYADRSLVSFDLKGFIEVVYFGDTMGSLWKLTELNADNQWDPQLELLFAPMPPVGSARPIYHKPAIADVYQNCVRRFVLFGTGDENNPIDEYSQDYFYEIEDRPYITPHPQNPEPDEYCETPENCRDWTSDEVDAGLFRMTWMKSLPTGEKVLSEPTTYWGVVYFTSYQPAGGCNMGLSRLWGLTTTMCGTEGGEPGLEYSPETDEPLDEPVESTSQQKGLFPTPTVGPPRLYIGTPHGPPITLKVPTATGQLLHWREVE